MSITENEIESVPYEVVFSNGDRAEAGSREGIILAAKTLCQEILDRGVWGTKPTAIFLLNGKCLRADVPSYQLVSGGAI